MKDDKIYIEHILFAIAEIEKFTKNVSEEQFLSDTLVHSAVIRQFEIIGEATKRLSPSTKARDNDIPWRDIAATRDVLIHEYFAVNLEDVWDTIVNDLLLFKKAVENLK